MAATQAEVDALTESVAGLNRAIDDGVRQVTLGAQTITYNTTASLIQARDDARARLNTVTAEVGGQSRPSRLRYVVYGGRGYHV